MAKRQLERWQMIERSITKKYRKELWSPFTAAMKRYEMVAPGDRVAVCISGGKDSMLMAKAFSMLLQVTEIPFTCRFLVMDPGYSEANCALIKSNLDRLHLTADFRDSPIFRVSGKTDRNPCYLCARMRRGYLYRYAQEMGCNKIALGHHFNDVIETTVMSLFYSSQLKGMMPKLHSKNFPGMELIRPLYRVAEKDIIAFWRRWGYTFLQCACPLGEKGAGEDGKRREIKALIAQLKENNPDIEKSIFNALHAVEIDTFPGLKQGEEKHPFTEYYK